MTSSPERLASLSRDSVLPVSRFQFLACADPSVIEQIRCGVLFVMAFWSGSAQLAFHALSETVAKLDPGGRLEFVVVDTDGCPGLYEVPEFAGRLHGHGEAAWIKDGRIVSTSGKGFNPACFEPNTRALLEACQA